MLITNKNRNHIEIVAKGKAFPSILEFSSILFTFCLTTLAWIFFRAETVGKAFAYIKRILAFSLEGNIQYLSIERYSIELLLLLCFFLFFEWNARENEHPFTGKFKFLKLGLIVISLLILGVYSNASDFIYFQF